MPKNTQDVFYDVANQALDYGIQQGSKMVFDALSSKSSSSGSKRTYLNRKINRKYNKRNRKTMGVYTGKLVPNVQFGRNLLKGKPAVKELKEIAGQKDDDNVVYIGIGLNYENLLENWFRLLCHALFSKANFQVNNYDNDIPILASSRIDTIYYTGVTTTAIASDSTALVVNETLNGAASKMRISWTAFTSPSGVHKIKEIRLYNGSTNMVATISGSNLQLSLSVYQTVLLQNQTLSATAGTNTDDVSANPLHIGVFDSNSNIVYQKNRDNTDITTWKPWLHYNDVYPEIFAYGAKDQFDFVGTTIIPNQVSNMFSNAKQTYRALLQPGEMKKIKLVHHFNGNINKWMKFFWRIIADDASDLPIEMPGKQRIIAFDKMLDQDASKVIVGYEMNQQTSGKWKYFISKNIVPIYS